MLQLIQLFLKANYKITFATACAKSDQAFNLKSIGVESVSIALNDSGFDTFVKQLNPKIVLFDRFNIEEQFGWRVSEQCPNAVKLLDTEDLHCLRKGRHAAFKKGEAFNDDYLYTELAKREIASILRCDCTLMISEYEIELLKNKFKLQESQLYYLPFLVEDSQINVTGSNTFEKRKNFVTIGNFLHEPNWQAVLLLKHKIWPKIRLQLPDAELHIYGAYVSQKATQLHQPKDGFYIKGFAEDVNRLMEEYRVCLSYLPFGAGLKGKILDAMRNGLPCAMNPIATEGMFGHLDINGICEEDINTFSDQAVQLYSNKNTWEEAQKNGYKVLEERFKLALFESAFIDSVEQLQQNLKKHRQEHFLGQVLQHHNLQSTKYMSKWIEAKNKL